MTPDTLRAAEATRLRLREAGYAPVPVEGKRTLVNGWQTFAHLAPEDIAKWNETYPSHTNTGGLTALMPTLDIDIRNPQAAEAVELLVRDRFGDTGEILVRTGEAPKRAVLFQTVGPFPKILCNLVAPNGDAKQKIEFLSKGQQVVLDGVHPDTRKPYTWRGGVPGDVKLKDLPYINEAEARLLVRDAVELLVAEHGYKIAPSRPKNGNSVGEHHSDGAKDWSWLMGAILDGAELHDATRDMAAKLVSAGVRGGAAVNIVRAAMERSKAPRDARFDERMRDIPRLVSSAEGKFEHQEQGPDEPISLADVFTFIEDKPASPPKELIKGLAEGVAVTGGQSTAGKTFIQIHKAICLATASAYFGHKVVERVGTAFVAAEGRALIHNRFHAACKAAKVTTKLPVTWLKQLPDFSSAEGIKLFIQQLKELDKVYRGDFGVRLGFLPVDTVAACFAMKDEDDNAEATKVCNVLRTIGEETGALAAPCHHYGKNPESGLRGASAWKASADIVEGVLADIDLLSGRTSNRELVCTKARDGEQGPLSPFELKFVSLGFHDDGEEYGSMHVVPAEGGSRFDKTAKINKGQRALVDAINEVMDGRSKIITPRSDMSPVRAVKVTDLREEFDRRYVVDEPDPDKAKDAKRMAFRRALDKLPPSQFAAGAVEGSDWIWRMKE